MAFEQIGEEICGKKIELYYEDTAADPDLCIQKVSRLVEREGVDIILGPLSGGEGTALKDYADNIPDTTIIVAGAASEDITMRALKIMFSVRRIREHRRCLFSEIIYTMNWDIRKSLRLQKIMISVFTGRRPAA